MNPYVINLVMAVLWVVAGVVILSWQLATGDTWLTLDLFGSHVSLGYAAFVLCGYNLIRWYIHRSRGERRRALNAENPLRRHHREDVAPLAEPDPNFQFTDPSTRVEPPTTEPRVGDPPPAAP